ncbi:MAG TPA: PDZ domain-containing protein [Verrucomicrobiae bacterium]|nr:PDZ domain-containing protein [Verrucomicrobiae bacterium]
MNRKAVTAALVAVTMGLAGPVWAPAWAGPEEDKERAELDRARVEVEKARSELQKATRELARSMARVERDNPRAQYFEYMTNPDRAVLGVLIPDDMENGETRGVRLLAVTPGSGADKAGLKAGDLIIAVNGHSLAAEGKLTSQKRMREQLRTLRAGDEAKIEYERDGRRSSATVKTTAPEPELAIAPLPMLQQWIQDENFEKAIGPIAPVMPAMPLQFRGPAIRGLELAKLDTDLGAYFKTQDGVLVVKAPKSGALNLKSGDVIQKIDGDPISEPLTVLDKLRSRGAEQNVRIDVLRQGRRVELQGKVPVADARARSRVRIINEDERPADDDR